MPRRLDVLVIPAPVPEPDPLPGPGRIEIEKDDDLPLHVEPPVVVPAVLGRHDPVAHEHQLRVLRHDTVRVAHRAQHDLGLHPGAGGERELLGPPAERNLGRDGRGVAHERDRLEPGRLSVGTGRARSVAHRLQLGREVTDGELVTATPGEPALEQVVGKEAGVTGDLGGSDPRRRGLLRGRELWRERRRRVRRRSMRREREEQEEQEEQEGDDGCGPYGETWAVRGRHRPLRPRQGPGRPSRDCTDSLRSFQSANDQRASRTGRSGPWRAPLRPFTTSPTRPTGWWWVRLL